MESTKVLLRGKFIVLSASIRKEEKLKNQPKLLPKKTRTYKKQNKPKASRKK